MFDIPREVLDISHKLRKEYEENPIKNCLSTIVRVGQYIGVFNKDGTHTYVITYNHELYILGGDSSGYTTAFLKLDIDQAESIKKYIDFYLETK